MASRCKKHEEIIPCLLDGIVHRAGRESTLTCHLLTPALMGDPFMFKIFSVLLPVMTRVKMADDELS